VTLKDGVWPLDQSWIELAGCWELPQTTRKRSGANPLLLLAHQPIPVLRWKRGLSKRSGPAQPCRFRAQGNGADFAVTVEPLAEYCRSQVGQTHASNKAIPS